MGWRFYVPASVNKDLGIVKKMRRKKPSLLDRLHDLAGKGDSGIADLATNPKYLKGFGQWGG